MIKKKTKKTKNRDERTLTIESDLREAPLREM
jgi:hypothetical protein